MSGDHDAMSSDEMSSDEMSAADGVAVPDETGPLDRTGGADEMSAVEHELLASFDRLAPEGGLRWGFDDAMRRLSASGDVAGAAAIPWDGLPDDLWERGRSALVGQRFVGDVAGVLAGILAADARRVADAAIEGRQVAAWDALRYLAARVAALEDRVDPVGRSTYGSEPVLPVPDVTGWIDEVGRWFVPAGPAGPGAGTGSPGTGSPAGTVGPIIVGESGDGSLLRAMERGGYQVRGVEPRGDAFWRGATTSDPAPDATGATGAGKDPGRSGDVTLGDVADVLRTADDASVAGALLVGCVDRLDLSGKVELLANAVRAVATGGTIALLVTDQRSWDDALSIPARDLAPGRPLHPETWMLLLRRAGVLDTAWHRPTAGTVHAVVGRVGR